MKTCPNPKCNMSGIPDDAMFCPKCGKPMNVVAATWRKNYDKLQKERNELLNKKQELRVFEQKRQELLNTLAQDPDFKPEMSKLNEIIRYNRYFVPLIQARVHIVGYIIFLFAVVFCVVNTEEGGGGLCSSFPILSYLIIEKVPNWITCLLAIIIGSLIGGCAIEYEAYTKHWSENKFIDNFYEPFVEQYMTMYEDISPWIEEDEHSFIEEEICKPEIITEHITRKIEKLDKQIQELDKQLQLMHELS